MTASRLSLAALSGQRGIRTPVGRSRQIYSLVHLTALPSARRLAPRRSSDQLAEGIEPTTAGLQNRCSTVELRERILRPGKDEYRRAFPPRQGMLRPPSRATGGPAPPCGVETSYGFPRNRTI